MSFPHFYDPAKVGTAFTPNTLQAVDEGRANPLSPAHHDTRKIALLLIDMQIDFIHADGALTVPGAIDDTRRTVEWIYTHLPHITTIIASLDSHLPIQIFSPTWWIGSDGKHPAPFTVITSAEVEKGIWKPLYHVEWSHLYVEKLEEQAKKQLMIWPYHTLIGTHGHNLTPALYEAIAFHSSARQSQPILLTKGDEPRTEHYSIIEPEVKLPESQLNTRFLDVIHQHDLIYVAGQAKSHCVLESVSSMMRLFGDNSSTVSKLRVLTDCMSSVAHPTIDFDTQANETFARFAKHGLTLIKSSDSLG